MKKILLLVVFSFLFCNLLSGVDIGKSLEGDANTFWSADHKKFITDNGKSKELKWQPLQKTLLYEFDKNKEKLFFMEQQISKASFKFTKKHLQGMFITFAVDNNQDRDKYLKDMEALKGKLKSLDKFSAPQLKQRVSGGIYKYSYILNSCKYTICLKWRYLNSSKTLFKAEPAKLSIFYRGKFVPSSTEEPASDNTADNEEKNEEDKAEGNSPEEKQIVDNKVEKVSADDVFLKVPMIVENNPKSSLSTCVSRVVQYYTEKSKGKIAGAEDEELEDQNKPKIYEYNFISELDMVHAIRKLINSRLYSVRKLIEPECYKDFTKFKALISAYNGYTQDKVTGQIYKIIRSRRELKHTNLMLMRIYYRKGSTLRNYIYIKNIMEIILRMNDLEALKKVQLRRKSTINKFKKEICDEIASGNPVVWDVVGGLIPEKNAPPVKGEYVRLIIGYNENTNQVIYSDSMGKGHEHKKMSWEDAWIITYRALTVKRRGLR
jgi:hypothetical protein